MTEMDSFIKFRGNALLCKHIWFLAPPIFFSTWPVTLPLSSESKTQPFLLLWIDVACLCFQELGWYYKFVIFAGWCVNLFSDNTWWLSFAVYLFYKIPRTPSSKKPVRHKKDTTIESDFKQKMMSWWNRTESGSSSTNREIETPPCMVGIEEPFKRSLLQNL